MKTVNLVFGVHWHAPVGLGEHDFETVYQENHKFFLSTLYEIEKLPVVLHYSGIVLEFLEKNHPEYLNLLDEMVKRRQVELVGGGFFDPILPLVPAIDKIGQIEMCTTYLRSHFGRRPRGVWLPEQVWDASLPNTLRNCGMEYTFLSESAFRAANCRDSELLYPHRTEEHGKNLIVFPLQRHPLALFEKRKPQEMIGYLRRQASSDGGRVISIMIDGEMVPRLTRSLNGKGSNWLKEFSQRLEKNQGGISPILPAEYLRTRCVRHKIYFSSTFSSEIYEATRPARRRKTRLIGLPEENGGSNFKQVFTKYRESNLLYAKMMYTHLTVHQIRGDKSRKKSALEELWRGQCHYGYWHGKHLGIYHNALRKEMYKSFINAEKYSRVKGTFLTSIITADFDFDGENELLYQSNEMNVYVHRQSGLIFELDYLPASWNYGDTMSRVAEQYHRNGSREYDDYPRALFIDHFFKFRKKTEAKSFSGKIIDLVEPASLYELKELKREQRQIAFSFNGTVAGNKDKPIALEKRYSFKKNTIVTDFLVSNTGAGRLELNFGSEINLSFLSPLKENFRIFDASKKTAIEIDAGHGERVHVKKIAIEDKINNVLLELSFGKPCSLSTESLTTKARDREKIKEQFQAVCLFPSWEIKLEPQESWEGGLELTFQKM